jgi:hypothetical protein
MVDRVWVAVEAAVPAGLEEKAVLEDPPKTERDLMWLAAIITDHVVGAIDKVTSERLRDASPDQ